MAVEAVLFTSFDQVTNRRWADDPRVEAVSVARWQPKRFSLREVDGTAPVDPDTGNPIRLRDFGGDVEAYFARMRAVYSVDYARKLGEWVRSGSQFTVAACWCPYSRTSRNQIDVFGTFVCHTEPLGWALRQMGVRVEYDSDRIDRMVRSQSPVAGYVRAG